MIQISTYYHVRLPIFDQIETYFGGEYKKQFKYIFVFGAETLYKKHVEHDDGDVIEALEGGLGVVKTYNKHDISLFYGNLAADVEKDVCSLLRLYCRRATCSVVEDNDILALVECVIKCPIYEEEERRGNLTYGFCSWVRRLRDLLIGWRILAAEGSGTDPQVLAESLLKVSSQVLDFGPRGGNKRGGDAGRQLSASLLAEVRKHAEGKPGEAA